MHPQRIVAVNSLCRQWLTLNRHFTLGRLHAAGGLEGAQSLLNCVLCYYLLLLLLHGKYESEACLCLLAAQHVLTNDVKLLLGCGRRVLVKSVAATRSTATLRNLR